MNKYRGYFPHTEIMMNLVPEFGSLKQSTKTSSGVKLNSHKSIMFRGEQKVEKMVSVQLVAQAFIDNRVVIEKTVLWTGITNKPNVLAIRGQWKCFVSFGKIYFSPLQLTDILFDHKKPILYVGYCRSDATKP